MGKSAVEIDKVLIDAGRTIGGDPRDGPGTKDIPQTGSESNEGHSPYLCLAQSRPDNTL